jgi:hypothetical protein
MTGTAVAKHFRTAAGRDNTPHPAGVLGFDIVWGFITKRLLQSPRL